MCKFNFPTKQQPQQTFGGQLVCSWQYAFHVKHMEPLHVLCWAFVGKRILAYLKIFEFFFYTLWWDYLNTCLWFGCKAGPKFKTVCGQRVWKNISGDFKMIWLIDYFRNRIYINSSTYFGLKMALLKVQLYWSCKSHEMQIGGPASFLSCLSLVE